MTTRAPDDLFQDPHSHITSLGTLKCKVDFVVSEKYPRTCSACSNLADVWDNDNESLKNGVDNFNATLEKMLQMLDTFIREESAGKKSGIHPGSFSPSDDCELTLLLLWQMRNIMAHNGGIVDADCKKQCLKIIQRKEKSVHPLIPIFESLEIDQKFVLNHQNFEKIKNCVFQYLKKRVSAEDYSILTYRATMAHFQITNVFADIPLPEGYLRFNIQEASVQGININLKTGKLDRPPGTTFSFEDPRIYLKNGKSLPAKFIPISEYNIRKS